MGKSPLMAVCEEVTADRIAKNQATFRDANEHIEDAAEEHRVLRPPFICECADPRCTELIELDLPAYETVRSNPTHFLVVPGHEDASGPHGRVVFDARDYKVVEKVGEIAKRRNPRAA